MLLWVYTDKEQNKLGFTGHIVSENRVNRNSLKLGKGVDIRMTTSNPILAKLLAILFGLVFATFSIPMIKQGYEELKNAQDSLNWPTTTGVIISSETKSSSGEDSTISYHANIQYQYTIGGKSYLSDQVSFGEFGSSDPEHARSIVRRYEKGQKIKVYFHPNYPDKSVLDPGVSWGSCMILVGGVIFFTMGSIIPLSVVFVAPKLQQRRTQALQQVAANLAMTFQEEDVNLSKQDFCRFPLFRHNSSHLRNILSKYGEDRETILFDYNFTTGSGDNSHTYAQTVAVFHTPSKNLPEFTLRPENVFDKIGELFGSQDIDFESHPDFSKFYCLQGQPESAIREILNFDTLQFFGQNHGWYLEASGEWLVIYKLNQTIKPEDMRNFLEQTTEISQLFTE